MTGYLIDTNVISELTKPAPETQVIEFLTNNDDLWLPAIVMYELEFGLQTLPEGRRLERLRSLQSSLVEEYEDRIIPIGQREAEMTAILQAEARRSGENIGLADCLIAGTARVHDLCVVTRDVKDFDPLHVAIHHPWPQ